MRNKIPPNIYIHPNCDQEFVYETVLNDMRARSLSDEELAEFKTKIMENISAIYFVPSLALMLLSVQKEIDRRATPKNTQPELKITRAQNDKEKD